MATTLAAGNSVERLPAERKRAQPPGSRPEGGVRPSTGGLGGWDGRTRIQRCNGGWVPTNFCPNGDSTMAPIGRGVERRSRSHRGNNGRSGPWNLCAEKPATPGAMTEPPRRFPAPWHANKIPGGYVVRDANGQALAYIYARATQAEAAQAKVLTADEARRTATNIARLPELLRRSD
jgi:hypothetical protein